MDLKKITGLQFFPYQGWFKFTIEMQKNLFKNYVY